MATSNAIRKPRRSQALVEIKGKQAFTTSIAIAEGCGLSHASVIKLIRKHQSHFEAFAPLRFEIQVEKRAHGGGSPTEYAVLTEDQATFAITLFRNNEIVIRFKVALVKAFRTALNELQRVRYQQLELDWQEQRSTGKTTRRELSGVIRQFVDYARAQGSQHAERYYSIITRMEYRALFPTEKVDHGLRDRLTAAQIARLTSAEVIAENALLDGMQQRLPYYSIYPLAKTRVEQFAGLMRPKSLH